MTRQTKDLVCLAADKNIEMAIKGILSRSESLGCRNIDYDVHVHPERDPGCFVRSAEFLRVFLQRFSYALVVFDREGSGAEGPRETLEAHVQELLDANGWRDRAAVIVPDPELETWVWSSSRHVDRVLGWKNKEPNLRSWLEEQGFLEQGALKPERPKEATESALWEVRRPRSSSLYKQLAEAVSLQSCADPAFTKLAATLQEWFPAKT